jgi:hypothetical protein
MGETRNSSLMDKVNLRVRIMCETNSLKSRGLNSNTNATEFQNTEYAIKSIYSVKPTVAGFPNNFPEPRFEIAPL